MRCVELFDHFIYFSIRSEFVDRSLKVRGGDHEKIFQNVSLTKRRFNDVTIAWSRIVEPIAKEQRFQNLNCEHKVAEKFRFSDRQETK